MTVDKNCTVFCIFGNYILIRNLLLMMYVNLLIMTLLRSDFKMLRENSILHLLMAYSHLMWHLLEQKDVEDIDVSYLNLDESVVQKFFSADETTILVGF